MQETAKLGKLKIIILLKDRVKQKLPENDGLSNTKFTGKE